MLPFMSDIWEHMLAEICPRLRSSNSRLMFFDLADPEKRDASDLAHALELVSRFQQFFDTYLGLNENESFEIGRVLGYPGAIQGPAAVESVADYILHKLGITAVVVHPRAYAVSASADGVSSVAGPLVGKPAISTGGGDHFNAGFCIGKLMGADNDIALQLGVGTSGYYVRTGNTPNSRELAAFLQTL